ncbi:hypothetical protein [Cellvibrio mixtus]|uniref:hypothetical protein n=1 Tax=Cellvibrio mixtus TaxID=39650 RepID=UPI0005874682|nr:hypothetical protein [Cellvibrio mixtus]
MNLRVSILLSLLITSLNACVVVPKKVASYDEKCKVAVQKITLDLAPVESDTDWHCTNENCAWDVSSEIFNAVLTTTTSAVVSGSVALAGNTLYWLESNGDCPSGSSAGNSPPEKRSPLRQQENSNDPYLIQEEIITAGS